jgi:autotransporter-associated beta strand protein
MKRIAVAAAWVIGLGTACVSAAGVITSIQRLDTDDNSPGFNESLVPGGLTAGAPAYADFSFTYSTLPSYLQAADYIKMVNADQYDFNYQLQLNLNARSNVYLMIDDRYGVTQWETGLGFVDTGDNILLGDQTTSIYRATFNSGPVVLRDQSVIEGSFHMYTVAAQSTGDITLTQSTTTGTATFNSLTLQAVNNAVDLTQIAGTTLTLTQGTIVKDGTFNSTISGGILATPSGTFNVTTNGGVLKIGSALTGSSNRLIVGGAGTLELSSVDTANHNFGGGIFLNSGTLRVSDVRNLGGSATNANAISFSGGALEATQALTLNNVFTVNPGGGTFRPTSSSSAIKLLSDNQLRPGSKGAGTLTKDGPGVLVIGGSNAFAGPVNVIGGALQLQDPDALGSPLSRLGKSTITLFDNTRLNLLSDQKTLNYDDPISVPGNSAIDFGRIKGTVAGDFFLKDLSFGNPNGAQASLTVTNAHDDGSVLHFTGPVTLGGASILDAQATTSLEGQVQGGGTFTKIGAGTVLLAGGATNNYTGLTTVLAGTLSLGKAIGALSIPSDLTINGGILRFDSNDQIADVANVSLLQGAFNANGRQDTIASLNVSGGSLTTGTGRLLILTPGAPASPLPGGPLPPPVPGLVISGGVTTVNLGGEINATTAQISGGVNTVQAGGVLTVGSGGLTFAGDLSPNVTLLADAATPGRLNLSGNVTFTGLLGTASVDTSGAQPGLIDLKGAERTFNVNDGAASVDLRVSASITNGAVKKSGAGTLMLSGVNTYTGGTTVSNGTIQVNGGAALGSGPFVLNAGTFGVVSDAVPSFANVLTINGDAGLNVDRESPAGPATGEVQFTGGLAIGASQLSVTGANRSIRFTGATMLTGSAKFNNTAGVNVTLTGPVGQSAGTWGVTKDGVGTLTFDGATPNTYTGSTRVNSGMLLLGKTAGQNAVAGNLDVFGGTVRLMASNQIADTAAVTVSNSTSTLDLNGKNETFASLNGTGGHVTLGGGAGGALLVTQALNLSGGTIDLTNNALVVNYAPGGAPATFNAVKAAVILAYNAAGVHWTGSGITSSTARDNAASNTGVGFAEASDIFGASGGIFQGQSVDATAVLARYTLLGDATLDGKVDFNDLVKLAQNYNTTGRTWNGGDFTYDGSTDFNDLVKLAQNYNTALPAAAAIPGAPANFDQDLARAFAQVPEPGGLGVMGLAFTALLRRRRSSRSVRR